MSGFYSTGAEFAIFWCVCDLLKLPLVKRQTPGLDHFLFSMSNELSALELGRFQKGIICSKLPISVLDP